MKRYNQTVLTKIQREACLPTGALHTVPTVVLIVLLANPRAVQIYSKYWCLNGSYGLTEYQPIATFRLVECVQRKKQPGETNVFFVDSRTAIIELKSIYVSSGQYKVTLSWVQCHSGPLGNEREFYHAREESKSEQRRERKIHNPNLAVALIIQRSP